MEIRIIVTIPQRSYNYSVCLKPLIEGDFYEIYIANAAIITSAAALRYNIYHHISTLRFWSGMRRDKRYRQHYSSCSFHCRRDYRRHCISCYRSACLSMHCLLWQIGLLIKCVGCALSSRTAERRLTYGNNLFQEAQNQQGRKHCAIAEGSV